MTWIIFIAGFIIGWISRIVFKYYRNIGHLDKSFKGTFMSDVFYDIKSSIRTVVLKTRSKNLDFLLNFSIDSQVLIQILHRLHYPELGLDEEDSRYGLAIYIPISELNKSKKNELNKLLIQHAESSFRDNNYDYYVIDAGERIKYAGELVTLILRQIFLINKDNLKTDIFIGDRTPYKNQNLDIKNLPIN